MLLCRRCMLRNYYSLECTCHIYTAGRAGQYLLQHANVDAYVNEKGKDIVLQYRSFEAPEMHKPCAGLVLNG